VISRGQPTEPLAKLKDRKFVAVNPDNFDQGGIYCGRTWRSPVENKLVRIPNAGKTERDGIQESGRILYGEVARRLAVARALELRSRMTDLRGNLQGNDK